MWIYVVRTGRLFQNDTYKATGYSGIGVGKNNPHEQSTHNIGPIPVGVYIVGVTWFARTEARESRKMELALATGVMAVVNSLIALYRAAVEDLGDRFRRKYGQLDNPEAAAIIACKDEDPAWRIEAAAVIVEVHP